MPDLRSSPAAVDPGGATLVQRPSRSAIGLGRGRGERTSAVVWLGRGLSGLFIVFILGASVVPKLAGLPVAANTLEALGWPARSVFAIGLLELALVGLYAVPRTRLLGAVLVTGLLGGAMATQIRADMPLISHQLFSLYLGLFMWGGLWLRDPRLRALFPLSRSDRL